MCYTHMQCEAELNKSVNIFFKYALDGNEEGNEEL